MRKYVATLGTHQYYFKAKNMPSAKERAYQFYGTKVGVLVDWV